jgi:hypothetical protein
MRAREFLREQTKLPPDQAEPMNHVFSFPGLPSSDPYKIYRVGIAIARARSDAGTDGITDNLPAWSAETAFGEDAVIAGFDSNDESIIDRALSMTATQGGKKLVSTPDSSEPNFVGTTSPVKAFAGYPR